MAPYSVSGPRGEDAQLVAARLAVVGRGREDDFGALGPADPVGLHDPDRLGPFDAGEVEQLVGVLRGAQVPLVQLALLDARAAAPAVAVRALDLLARQRPVVGAPVDRRLGAVGEPGLEEPQEDPLVPAVVVGVAGDDLALPVERGAHRAQLAPHVVDVLQRPRARVDLVLDRGVLGRQPERVEADRQEDVLAVHAVEAGQRVGRGLDVPVPDVQVARRVRVHRQQVVLGPARRRPGPCRTGRAPPSASASAARWPRARSDRCGCALALWCRHDGPLIGLARADDPPDLPRPSEAPVYPRDTTARGQSAAAGSADSRHVRRRRNAPRRAISPPRPAPPWHAPVGPGTPPRPAPPRADLAAPRAPLGPISPPPGLPLGPISPPPGAPLGPISPPPGLPLGPISPPPGSPSGRSGQMQTPVARVQDRAFERHPPGLDWALARRVSRSIWPAGGPNGQFRARRRACPASRIRTIWSRATPI